MVNYDSDSSGGEDNDYTETNVLLGYASSDANGEEISRLGGRPDWLDPSHPPSAALARCKVCKDLMVLLLQLNAELPERFPGHERRLYVFSCRRKSCRRKEGSIRAIRGVRVSDTPTTTTTAAEKKEKDTPAPVAPSAASLGLGEALFGVKAAASTAGSAIKAVNPFATGGAAAAVNPFASKSSSASAANPFAPKTSEPAQAPAPAQQEETKQKEQEAETKRLPETFAQKLSLNNDQALPTGPAPPPEPWPPASSENDTRPYPVKWLSDAEYETLDPTPALPAQATQIMDLDTDAPGSSGSGGGKEDKEVFESTMDSIFQKFADRVGQNPEQCIRYEFNGVPLLYSKNDTVGKLIHTGGEGNEKVKTTGAKGIPRCTNCGAGRVFEVQMTPHAITELEEGDGDENDMVLDGMDWGTVILGVCEKDCLERGSKKGEAGYVEEWVGVQWEELSVKR